MNKNRIVFLDYLRIIAFAIVILGHKFSNDLISMSNDTQTHITLRYIYSILFDASIGGAMGVVIFFLVSGYIITHVLQTESTSIFYLKRIFRIYPLYVFAVILEVFLGSIQGASIPSLGILIPRLLLIGDLFNTPLALGGVEWTLRIEIMFYIFMGIIKSTGLFKSGNVLTILLTALTYLLSTLPAFPETNDFHNAYFSIYTPFLFIGVITYLIEKCLVNRVIATISIVMMFNLHYSMIIAHAPSWGNYNYAFIGALIFFGAWHLRSHLSENKICTLLSELTYSIYLLHLLLWGYISDFVSIINLPYINPSIQILIFLLLICYLVNKLIEKPGVSLGKSIKHQIFNNKITANQV